MGRTKELLRPKHLKCFRQIKLVQERQKRYCDCGAITLKIRCENCGQEKGQTKKEEKYRGKVAKQFLQTMELNELIRKLTERHFFTILGNIK